MEKLTDSKKKKLILTGFILLMLIQLVFTFAGFYGGDDINYARYAAGIADNGISNSISTDHFQLRWTTIYITAFFYKLFGINEFSSSLFSFISLFFCGLLIYKVCRRLEIWIFALILGLFFFSNSILFYMHRLLPDLALGFCVFWMYYSYRSFINNPGKQLIYGFQFSLALFFAVITKETIVIALPLFIVFFITDLLKKRHFLFWKITFLLSISFVGLYLIYFKLSTGDYLYRYNLLQSTQYFSECSFDKLPFRNTLNRIVYQLWEVMLLNGDFLIYIPAITALFYRKKLLKFELIQNIDTTAFFILLCSANCMTISFSSYVPLCHDPRHFIFLIPFAAIIGGPLVYSFFKTPQKFILLPLLFLTATIILFANHAGTTKYLYLLISFLLFIRYVVTYTKYISVYSSIIFSFIFVAMFSGNYFIYFIKPFYPYYWDNKKIIQTHFADTTDAATVFFSDPFSAELSEFFLNFKTGKLKFLSQNSFETKNYGKIFYLVNSSINPIDKYKMDSLMLINNNPANILVEQRHNVYLYKITNDMLENLMR